MSKSKLMGGVCALICATSTIAGTASAQVTTQTYGTANGLFAPELRQSEDCYGNPIPLVIQGLNTHSPTTISIAPFNYTGATPFNCATTHVDAAMQLNTMSTTSGTGVKGLYSHDPVTFWGDTVPPGGNNTPYPTVTFITSEVPLAANDVTTYLQGGVEQGITFTSSPGAGQYPIPGPKYGALIQFPMVIGPLDFAYSSTYKRVRQADGSVTSYHFELAHPRADGSGGLVLDASTYCKIFNGQITDWNQIPTSLNGGVSLQDPTDTGTFSVPLIIVGRNDSSSSNGVLSRHLATVCPALITGNLYPDWATLVPTLLRGPHWLNTNPNYGPGSGVTDNPGHFTLVDGVPGMAEYLDFDPNNLPGPNPGDSVVQGRIGYIGNDSVLPYVSNTGQNRFGLNSASILRAGNSKPVSPSATTAALAFAVTIKPPSGGNQTHPDLWVQPPSKTAAIANPVNVKAYPLIGTHDFVGYTCYAAADVATKLPAFLNWFETSPIVQDSKLGLLAQSGLSPMPSAWRIAISHTFLKSDVSANPLNLHILQAGTGPASGTNSQCNAITPGA